MDDFRMQGDFDHQIPAEFIPNPPKAKKKKRGIFKVVALALCFSLLGGALGAGGTFLLLKQKGDGITISKSPEDKVQSNVQIGKRPQVQHQEVDTGELMTPAQVYDQNVNSTVGITTSITTNLWGYQSTAAAAGSGFILTEDGYILTNYHVIEASSAITVSLFDGTTYDATLIGYDESNDIAVIKVDAENLVPVVIGATEDMRVGDTVMAIGNPLGELTFSLTLGVISAMDRQVTMSTGSTMNLLQTDCSINSGNSGGALFNLYGEVVGITNAKYSNNGNSAQATIENIGFAIPIDHAMPIVESIIEKGYIAKPYIGVTVSDVGQESQNYGLPQGAAVQSVTEDAPAAKAGLKQNDIITHVNGEAISGSSELVDAVGKSEVGDELEFTVYRQGETVTIKVTVGEQVQSTTPESQPQQQPQQPSISPWR